MLEIVIRPRALLDIDSNQIFLVTCTGDCASSDRFIDHIYGAMEKLAEFPGMGSLVESEAEGEYRRFLVDSKYWVYYTHDDETLLVWRVLHAKQDVDDFAVIDW